MYCLEREYLKEETKCCALCSKWINNRYIMLVEPNDRKYFHLLCYKYLLDKTFL